MTDPADGHTIAELRRSLERTTVMGYDELGEWRFAPWPAETVAEIKRLALKALDDEERAGEQLTLLR